MMSALRTALVAMLVAACQGGGGKSSPSPAGADAASAPPAARPPRTPAAPEKLSGIGIRPVTHEKGFMIGQVFPGSPAEAGGLRVGDVVVAVDGESTARWSLQRVAERLRGAPGTPIVMEIEREGAEMEVRLVRAQLVDPGVPTQQGEP